MSLLSGLVHLWPMDETSGALVDDVVGDLGSGSVVDDALGETIVDSAAGFGKARDLAAPAGGAYINLYTGAPDGGAYALTAWTVSVRYRTTAGASAFGSLFFQGSGTNPNTIDFYLQTATNKITCDIRDSAGITGGVDDVATADVDDGTWRRATVTSDGSTLKVYHGSQLIGSAVLSNPLVLYPKNLNIYIGTYIAETVDKEPPGEVDDFAIWSRALTQAEIESSAYQDDPIPSSLPLLDWTDAISLESSTRYTVLDIEHSTLDTIRVPISSWQATTQSGQSSFSQAVIPGALAWVDAISDRLATGVMVITHGVRHIDGTAQEWEVIRAPIQQFFFDRGGINATARISSYYTVAAVTPESVKVLQNIRSISTSSAGLRVRCDFDPTLKPGDTASANGTEFTVAYINAYENSSDRYMDAGERAV